MPQPPSALGDCGMLIGETILVYSHTIKDERRVRTSLPHSSYLIQFCIRVELYTERQQSVEGNKIEQYFFSGRDCAYCQNTTDVYTDLRHNQID